MKEAVRQAFVGAPAYFRKALSYLGTKELVDGAINPLIRKWIVNHTRFPSDLINPRTMWCGAFVSHCLEASGHSSMHSAKAEHYLAYGVPCGLEQYAICVLRRGLSDEHVGFVASVESDSVLILGGNQSDQVCIKAFPLIKVLGCRKPAKSG